MLYNFSLTQKVKLTPDVFWLEFSSTQAITPPIEWQFLTFLLPNWLGGRAYSILNYKNNTFELIIKRLENGKWGSKYLCDLPVWSEVKWVGPAGHFVLQNNPKNKLFLGTGTWFVPLYYQIIWSIEKQLDCQMKFIFWVREKRDMFYEQELRELSEGNSNFSYDLCLTQENISGYHFGRITSKVDENLVKNYEEFYICGSPAMVDDMVQKLQSFKVDTKQIFTEKY